MKLHELSATTQSSKVTKVFESYFGQGLSLNKINGQQASNMLRRVRGLLGEVRRSTQRHNSQNNPGYLKLVMLEQALVGRIKEMDAQSDSQLAAKQMSGTRKTATATGASASQLDKAMQSAAAGKALDPTQRKAMSGLAGGIQKMMGNPADAQRLQQMLQKAVTAETRKKKTMMREASEVQEAQVVLAAQDMVDQVQKMIEQVSAMQFKDLPALVDTMKGQIGTEQAQQFNADANAALGTLVQSLQSTKVSLDGALGMVTGQEMAVPGADDMGDGLPPETMPGGDDVEADLSLDANLPAEEPEPEPKAALGRERR